MEYAIAKVYFLGNDDVNFQGFAARKVDSLKDWKKQVKKTVEDEFESSDYVEISTSDNEATTFESAEEVLNTISFKKITEEDFKTLSKLFGGNNDVVQYGNDIGYLDYKSSELVETPKKKLKR